jgi:hypothetical protein
MSRVPGNPTPGKGDVLRLHAGTLQTIATGLTFPTGMTFGRDMHPWGSCIKKRGITAHVSDKPVEIGFFQIYERSKEMADGFRSPIE